MDRHTFLTTLVALPVGLVLVSCSSSTSDAGAQETKDPAMPPVRNGTTVTFYGSTSQNHTHSFDLPDSAVAGTAQYANATSRDPGDMHEHLVTISADQLAQIAAGQTVQVPSSVDNNHIHYYTFMKVS